MKLFSELTIPIQMLYKGFSSALEGSNKEGNEAYRQGAGSNAVSLRIRC